LDEARLPRFGQPFWNEWREICDDEFARFVDGLIRRRWASSVEGGRA
jgi:hypothetical protein